MKLIRWGLPDSVKPGIFLQNKGIRLDVSAFGEDYTETFFATNGPERLADWLWTYEGECPVLDEDVRWAEPVARPSKIVCIGLNYKLHAEESGSPIPKEPIIFFKSTSAISGPYDEVIIPQNSVKTDWEVELAFVIGKKASYVPESLAMDHVSAYLIHNDYSEREFQLERGGQWVKGKSADTFAPLGPYLVTKDEIKDPHSLRLWLRVNGEKLQDSNTGDMIFGISFLVHYLSQFMTLLPGDIISTGTPSGVGLGLKPPRYLQPGDVVECGIEGLGTMKQHIAAYRA